MSTTEEAPASIFPPEATTESLRSICVREADIGLPHGGKFNKPSGMRGPLPAHDDAVARFEATTDKWLSRATNPDHADIVLHYRAVGLELLGLHPETTLDPRTLTKKWATDHGAHLFLPLSKGGYIQVRWATNCRTEVFDVLTNLGSAAYLEDDRPCRVIRAYIEALGRPRP